VAEGKATTVELKDEYAKQTGNLTIKKSVGGNVTAEELEKAAITFEVKTADGKWLDKDGNVSETEVLLTLGEKDGFVYRERFSGSASRSFYLGDVEENEIKASFENGILKVVLPKKVEKEPENKTIVID
jgi:hypothetical protein